jgi:DNA-3-methyladenine glycosylase
MGKRLKRKFFEKPVLDVARRLLGKILVRKIGEETFRAVITEVEAYRGPQDLASHASKGRTKRTEVMFGPPGHAYVYFIYGMYFCLNVVTARPGLPHAVLFRGVRLLKDGSGPKLNGPGKLCKFLKIDKSLYGADMVRGADLWIEDDGLKLKPAQIGKSKRVGVEYAGPWKDKPWRFFIKKQLPS